MARVAPPRHRTTFLRAQDLCAPGRAPAEFARRHLQAGGLDLAGTGVTEKVVARADVVDAQAVRTGEALADVALQQVPVVDDGDRRAGTRAGFIGDVCRRIWQTPGGSIELE